MYKLRFVDYVNYRQSPPVEVKVAKGRIVLTNKSILSLSRMIRKRRLYLIAALLYGAENVESKIFKCKFLMVFERKILHMIYISDIM